MSERKWAVVPVEATEVMISVSVHQPMTIKGSRTATARWHLYAAMIAASPSPVEDEALVTELAAALDAAEAAIKPCPRCGGKGYHHGFGEDGHDPDWCADCGGSQFAMVCETTADRVRAILQHLNGRGE